MWPKFPHFELKKKIPLTATTFIAQSSFLPDQNVYKKKKTIFYKILETITLIVMSSTFPSINFIPHFNRLLFL